MIIFLINLIVGIMLFASTLVLVKRVLLIEKIKKRNEGRVLWEANYWKITVMLIIIMNIAFIVSIVSAYEVFQVVAMVGLVYTTILYTGSNNITMVTNKEIYTLGTTIKYENIDCIYELTEKKVSIALKKGGSRNIFVNNKEELKEVYKEYLDEQNNR